MQRRLMWGLVAIVLVVGVGYSIWDYRAWQKVDRGNYGQGNPADSQFIPAQSLDRPVTALNLIRIKPPLGWETTHNSYWETRTGFRKVTSVSTEVVQFAEPTGSVSIQVSVSRPSGQTALFSEADAEGTTQDRQYITSEEGTWEVLTWEDVATVKQRAAIWQNGMRWDVITIYSGDSWKTWRRTIEHVLRSVIWL